MVGGRVKGVALLPNLNLYFFFASPVPAFAGTKLDRGTQSDRPPNSSCPELDPGIWLRCGSILPGKQKSRQIPGSRYCAPEDDAS